MSDWPAKKKRLEERARRMGDDELEQALASAGFAVATCDRSALRERGKERNVLAREVQRRNGG